MFGRAVLNYYICYTDMTSAISSLVNGLFVIAEILIIIFTFTIMVVLCRLCFQSQEYFQQSISY